jgi:hypothetical protein
MVESHLVQGLLNLKPIIDGQVSGPSWQGDGEAVVVAFDHVVGPAALSSNQLLKRLPLFTGIHGLLAHQGPGVPFSYLSRADILDKGLQLFQEVLLHVAEHALQFDQDDRLPG